MGLDGRAKTRKRRTRRRHLNPMVSTDAAATAIICMGLLAVRYLLMEHGTISVGTIWAIGILNISICPVFLCTRRTLTRLIEYVESYFGITLGVVKELIPSVCGSIGILVLVEAVMRRCLPLVHADYIGDYRGFFVGMAVVSLTHSNVISRAIEDFPMIGKKIGIAVVMALVSMQLLHNTRLHIHHSLDNSNLMVGTMTWDNGRWIPRVTRDEYQILFQGIAIYLVPMLFRTLKRPYCKKITFMDTPRSHMFLDVDSETMIISLHGLRPGDIAGMSTVASENVALIEKLHGLSVDVVTGLSLLRYGYPSENPLLVPFLLSATGLCLALGAKAVNGMIGWLFNISENEKDVERKILNLLKQLVAHLITISVFVSICVFAIREMNARRLSEAIPHIDKSIGNIPTLSGDNSMKDFLESISAGLVGEYSSYIDKQLVNK